MHHAAVRLTNTGLPLERSESSLARVKDSLMPVAADAVAETAGSGVTVVARTMLAIAAATQPAARTIRAGWLSGWSWPSHNAKAIAIIPSSTANTPSAPVCCARTHTNQAAEAYSGKARNCLRVFIQRPGLGSRRAQVGTK